LSKHETPLTRWYWSQVGGLLIEEFKVVKSDHQQGKRHVDGLIVLGEPTSRTGPIKFEIQGRDVIAIQTKASRLGMNLMGQCLFSRDLVIGLGAKTVRSIALCTQDDFTLRPLLEQHQGCEVVVFDGDLDTLAPYTPQGIS
jgi:hypothetical protein